MLTHVVLFWLKADADSSVRDALLSDCQQLLRQIPTVRQISAGRPAMTPRDVVDNSYDVGLCVVCDDKSALDQYQDHPLHKQFLAKHKEHWSQIRVYDFV